MNRRTGAPGHALPHRLRKLLATRLAKHARVGKAAHPAAEEPLRLDLRGLWGLVGAWSAALAGVRLTPPQQGTAMLIMLGVAGIGVLFLLRERHAQFNGETAPFFAAPALMCAAAGLVLAQLVLTGAGTVPEPLRQASDHSTVVRLQLELSGTPRARTMADSFFANTRTHTSYRVEARTTSMRAGEHWLPAASTVSLGYAGAFAPAGPGVAAGTRVEVLARISPAPAGQRIRFWLTAVAPVQALDIPQDPRPVDYMRLKFLQHVAPLPDTGRALLPGMVFGERGGQSEELADAMKAAGLSHLTAVSGDNVVKYDVNMKAAIYVRVSQDPTGQATSVSSQEKACREECERRGWTIAKVFMDNDRSASRYATKEREGFAALLGSLPEYDVLVTWEASRATRDMEVYVSLRKACRDAGVKWCYSGRVYDLTRTDDSFSTGLDLLVAERESGQTSDRVQRAVRQQAQSGKPHGRVPFGYIREYDHATGKLVDQIPHPEESIVIIEAADRILNGESAYAVAKDFQNRGLTMLGKNYWIANRLVRLLKNPTYAGKRVYRGEVIGEATWEPLIPEGKWEALQAILTNPARTTAHHGSEPAHLLSGIAQCGECDGVCHRLVNRGKYAAYYCRNNGCVSRSQPGLDELVNAVIVARLSAPDALEAMNRRKDPEVEPVLKEIRELKLRLEGIYEQAANGQLSAAGLVAVESNIHAKIADAKERLKNLSTPSRVTIPDPAHLASNWDTVPLLQKRDIIRSLMKVRVMRAPKGSRFTPEYIKIEWK